MVPGGLTFFCSSSGAYGGDLRIPFLFLIRGSSELILNSIMCGSIIREKLIGWWWPDQRAFALLCSISISFLFVSHSGMAELQGSATAQHLFLQGKNYSSIPYRLCLKV